MSGRASKSATLTVLVCAGILLCASLGACAPSTASTNDATGVSEADGAFTWSPDASCDTCHSVEQESFGNAECTAALHEAVPCVTCHVEGDAIVAVHEGATVDSKQPKRLKKTAVEETVCLSCHNVDELKSATASSTVLTDDEGKTVNPHDLPEVADHESILCSTCHKMHGGDGIETESQDTCLSCHHKNVYECKTCHD